MYALIVKDNGGYNPFGYNIWNGFSQTNNDELQKVEVKAKFSTPSLTGGGYVKNEKTIFAAFYSTIAYAASEAERINTVLAEYEQPQHNFIIVHANDLSKMVSEYT